MRKPASVKLHSIYSDTVLRVLQGTVIQPTPSQYQRRPVVDTEPARWTDRLLHSNVQLEEFNQTGPAEAETIAAEATLSKFKFSDKFLFTHSPFLS